ncbi:hypothetical protein ACFL4G_01865 [Thermodesulfobacteriota bacterium]
MRKSLILLFCTVFLFSAANVMALGLGPYFSYEMGTLNFNDLNYDNVNYINWDHWDSLWGNNQWHDVDVDNNKFVIGFLLDSCVARNSLFNYRLNLGVTIVDYEPDVRGAESINGAGFDMKHTFGFGFVRFNRVRVWAGPALKFYTDIISGNSTDVINIGVGPGAEMGVNIHVTDFLSIGVSFAYFYNFVFSDDSSDLTDPWDDDDDPWDPYYGYWDPYYGYDSDDSDGSYSGREHMFCIQIAPIFRVGGDKF